MTSNLDFGVDNTIYDFYMLTLNFLRVLTPYEASSLVALLHTKDCEILERALVTVSNSAAFSSNQVNVTVTIDN